MPQDQQKENKQIFLKNPKYILCVAVIIIIAVLCVIFKYKALVFIIILLSALVTIMIIRKILRKRKEKNLQEVAQYTLADNEINKLAQYFVSRDEKYISSLGNGYIMNYLANRSFSKGFSVITNKRVYFRGSCFSGRGKALIKTNEERTVDIKDVTGSGFIYNRYVGLLLGLITAFFVFVIGIVAAGMLTIAALQWAERSQQRAEEYQQTAEKSQRLAEQNQQLAGQNQQWAEEYRQAAKQYQHEAEQYQHKAEPYQHEAERAVQRAIATSSITGALLPFAISCFLVFLDYLKKRKTMFQIQYAGGCIAFNVSYYAKAEIDDFQKQLRRTKDLAEASTPKITVAESPVQPSTQNSVPDELRKYADLLKEGLISQEEYDAMKKKILNL